MTQGLRVVVIGASGALGSEVLAVLDERGFPVRELVAVAGERSIGAEIEFRGDLIPVLGERPVLRGADLVFLCAPPSVSLDMAADALRAEAPVIDLSGALAATPEVPLLLAGTHQPAEHLNAPAIATPPGPALAWLRALLPLDRAFRLRRVVATTLEAASRGGREGIESLSAETVALFNQSDPPEPQVFGRPVAFDCVPVLGRLEADGSTDHEAQLAALVRRLLGERVGIAVSCVQVPTFCGDGSSLAIETERGADPSEAIDRLRKAPGVEVESPDGAPTTRSVAGTDRVRVGRVRRDPSSTGGLLLWLAADTLRLAASNAVDLAEARLRTH
jgi:aspartate-semialdehyde dehydrogenase